MAAGKRIKVLETGDIFESVKDFADSIPYGYNANLSEIRRCVNSGRKYKGWTSEYTLVPWPRFT